LLTVLSVLAVLFLVTARAEAAYQLSAQATAGWTVDSWHNTDDQRDEQTQGFASIAVSDSYYSMDATARARATYGSLGIYGKTSGYVWNAQEQRYTAYAGIRSAASFADDLTITSSLVPNGNWGSITLTASLNGFMTGASSDAAITFIGNNGNAIVHPLSGLGQAPISVELGSILFQFGTPFEIFIELAGSTTLDGEVDLEHTAWLSGITVRNGSTLISDYQLTAASGQAYPIATPVPPAVLLLGSGLIGLIGIRRFKK
jgi:hypothetical protein